MAEEGLDVPDVCAAAQEMHGDGMPEQMRMHPAIGTQDLGRVPLQPLLESAGIYPLAASAEEIRM